MIMREDMSYMECLIILFVNRFMDVYFPVLWKSCCDCTDRIALTLAVHDVFVFRFITLR